MNYERLTILSKFYANNDKGKGFGQDAGASYAAEWRLVVLQSRLNEQKYPHPAIRLNPVRRDAAES